MNTLSFWESWQIQLKIIKGNCLYVLSISIRETGHAHLSACLINPPCIVGRIHQVLEINHFLLVSMIIGISRMAVL